MDVQRVRKHLIISGKYDIMILTGDNSMFQSHAMLMDKLKNYASPQTKITRLLKSGKLVQIRRGLFTDDINMSRCVMAPVLYGPSYISFQYALSFYGLIPERVEAITSAAYNKNKNKFYRTAFGNFYYYYLPNAVYPFGININEDDGASYLIATAEKALCDTLYKVAPVKSVRSMSALLHEDIRIEKSDLANLDSEFIKWISPMYKRTTLTTLAKWFDKEIVKEIKN
jgi:predicted transcriptional regulator of viral defense system